MTSGWIRPTSGAANMVLGDKDDRLVTGLSLAEVSSRQSLDRALELADYDGMRAEQAAARAQGRYLGIGFATFIEAAPGPPEMRIGGGAFGGEKAKVRLEADGHVVVVTSQAPHGQSHETTLAQIAADEMGVPFDHVRVLHGDTRITPFSLLGTGGSRAATWASGAVLYTTRRLKEKVLAIAAELLEISPEDLEINDAVITPRGMPQRSLPLAQIAQQAYLAPSTLPAGHRCVPRGGRGLHRRGHHRKRMVRWYASLPGRARYHDRSGQDPALHRGGGLWAGHQSGSRRRPDPGWGRPGHRRSAP